MNSFEQYPIINQGTFNMLKKNTASNPEILTELFQSFIEDAGALIADIKTASQNNDNDCIYANVHTLKGLCGTIGCSRLFEVLKVMDTYNKEKSFDRTKNIIADLELVFSETNAIIGSEINQ